MHHVNCSIPIWYRIGQTNSCPSVKNNRYDLFLFLVRSHTVAPSCICRREKQESYQLNTTASHFWSNVKIKLVRLLLAGVLVLSQFRLLVVVSTADTVRLFDITRLAINARSPINFFFFSSCAPISKH